MGSIKLWPSQHLQQTQLLTWPVLLPNISHHISPIQRDIVVGQRQYCVRAAQMAGFMNSAVILVFLAFLAVEVASVNVTSAIFRKPDQISCPRNTNCKGCETVCPDECPRRGINNAKGKACYLDCKLGCYGVCRHRKPNCAGNGAMCYDPRIMGGDGVMFYFHGRKNQDFCLVSDSDLHINAHFIGKRPEGRPRDFTWVQALGFIFGSHTLSVAAKKVAKWDKEVDRLELTHNAKPFMIDTWATNSWTSEDGQVTLERISDVNSVRVELKERMAVSLSVVPIGKKESDVHKYQIDDKDCSAHLDMEFSFYNLSASVNGVLGQTYQPGYVSPVKRGVAMPIMGGADRYFTPSLLSADCKMRQFTGTAVPAGSALAQSERPVWQQGP